MISLGRKNGRGKNREITDFSHLIDKVEEKNDINEIEIEDKKEE